MPYSSQTSRFISAGTLRTFLVYPVLWVDFSQTRYPVIVVPGDVDIPVVCRSAIGQGNNRRLHDGAIYVRTLEQQHAPSSAPASSKDIEKLFEVCFRNREANYAEFFSRVIRAADPAAVRSLYRRLAIWLSKRSKASMVSLTSRSAVKSALPRSFASSPC